MMHGMMGRTLARWRGLQVAVQLSDGQWLSFATALPQDAPAVSWQFMISMAVMAPDRPRRLGLGGAARHRAAGNACPPPPIGSAATSTAAPLAEAGTVEMRQAAHAFNGCRSGCAG